MSRIIVITGFGINCEEETAAAFRLAGAAVVDIIHIQALLLGQVVLMDYEVLAFAGGFSFGDDLGAGKVLANKIRYQKLPNNTTLLEQLENFLEQEKYILGICNGFQVLVRLGLLPNIGLAWEEEVSLVTNNSAKFEDRWVYCKVNPNTNSPFLKNLDIIELPVRHAEGKLIVKTDYIKEQIIEQHLDCLTYCDAAGVPTQNYPANPNGAVLNCAALTNKTGNVLGMMPHPEAYLTAYNHPNWNQKKQIDPNWSETGTGLKIFSNIVTHIQARK